jgi:hypothetical protein
VASPLGKERAKRWPGSGSRATPIVNSFTTAATDVVNSRAELHAHIQRNIVYLRDLTEPNPLIIPPPPGGGARLVVSPTSLYIVRIPDYGLIGFLEGPLTLEER